MIKPLIGVYRKYKEEKIMLNDSVKIQSSKLRIRGICGNQYYTFNTQKAPQIREVFYKFKKN